MNILQALHFKKIVYRLSGTNNVVISCLSGVHKDVNPSMSISLDKELFHCFSCGFSGNKKMLFEALGIEQEPYDQDNILDRQQVAIQLLRDKLENFRNKHLDAIEYPDDAETFCEGFKLVGAETIQRFHAFTTDSYNLSNYLCFPILHNNKIISIIGRHFQDKPTDSSPKYLILPAGAKIGNVLFPIDEIQDCSTIIMVEGLFDMLKMWDIGYTNTVCLFGLNLTDSHIKSLLRRGCIHVILMLDGDAPGQRAMRTLANTLTKHRIKVSQCLLPEDSDPNSLDPEIIHELLTGNLEE